MRMDSSQDSGNDLRQLLIDEWGEEEVRKIEQLAKGNGMTLRQFIDACIQITLEEFGVEELIRCHLTQRNAFRTILDAVVACALQYQTPAH